jgi:hypothetical protein
MFYYLIQSVIVLQILLQETDLREYYVHSSYFLSLWLFKKCFFYVSACDLYKWRLLAYVTYIRVMFLIFRVRHIVMLCVYLL